MKLLISLSVSLNLIFLFILIVIFVNIPKKESGKVTYQTSQNQNYETDTFAIVMLGNSLTYNGDWQKLLGRSDVHNCGITDFTSQQLGWILNWCVIANKPSICFINGGHEDVFLKVPLEAVSDNFAAIADTLKNHNIKPVFQSLLHLRNQPELNVKIKQINVLLKAYCERNNIDYIDLNTVLCDSGGVKSRLSTDGMQLNDDGYTQWGNQLKEYLQKNPIEKK